MGVDLNDRHIHDLDGSLAYPEHAETLAALHEAEAEVHRLEGLLLLTYLAGLAEVVGA